MLSRFASTLLLLTIGGQFAAAADIPPPMLDITRQCDAASRHNVRAMSECVVAESEARAELLSNWSKYSDTSADKCIKVGHKAKRQPYTPRAKCMSLETEAGPTASPK